MRIFNAMFGCGLGGIEQAFINYTDILARQGHEVLSSIHPKAAIRPQLDAAGYAYAAIGNLGAWDISASYRLASRLADFDPDAIIAHGNRALVLLSRAARRRWPVIADSQNYNFQHLAKSDAIFATTKDMIGAIKQLDLAPRPIFHIPNMIAIPPESEADHDEKRRRDANEPIVIGAMGRFVKKKGFDVALRAMAGLERQGADFRFLLGGSGEEESALKALARELGLDHRVEFCGWIEDKDDFFSRIDIFCVPSLHEPFGIVFLEAAVAGVPVVTSDCEGAMEIFTSGRDAFIVPKGDDKALAEAVAHLIRSPSLRPALAMSARNMIDTRYAADAVGRQITRAIEEIIAARPATRKRARLFALPHSAASKSR